jgi:hypothetical protein
LRLPENYRAGWKEGRERRKEDQVGLVGGWKSKGRKKCVSVSDAIKWKKLDACT